MVRISNICGFSVCCAQVYGVASSPSIDALSIVPTRQHHIPIHPLTHDTLSIVRRWIRDCLDHHRHSKTLQPTRLPDRLVDVGQPDGSVSPVLLDGTEGIIEPYLALSHCWGGIIPYRTLRSNKIELCRRIQLSLLSKNFQDAITVARWLKFLHIWIDSLCIVQDDPQDWLHQASEMASIYSGAFLTISAARSSHYDEGFLLKRNTDSLLSISDKLRPGVELYARRDSKLELCHDEIGEEVLLERPENNPLFKRGWTLEERLLSPRVLHFTGSELIYECQERARCECGARGLPFKALKAAGLEGRDTGNYRLSMHKRWCRLVEQYTCRRLTYSLDILPVFSAVARSQSITGYLAGLRTDHFLVDLLWCSAVYKGTETEAWSQPTRAGVYTAPSFSWVSVIGPIGCVHVIWFRYFRSKVEGFFVSLENPADLFGRVKDGWIGVRGRIVKAYLLYPPEIQPSSLFGWVHRHSHQIDVSLDAADDPPSDTPVICIVIAEKLGARESRSFGLVLKRSQTRIGMYERIGCFLDAPEPIFQGSQEESITIILRTLMSYLIRRFCRTAEDLSAIPASD